MHLPSGTLTTADRVFKAIGGKDLLLRDAIRIPGAKPLAWFNTRIASLLTRARKQATVIAVNEAAAIAHAEHVQSMVTAP